ncbi:ZYRO0G18304p [Zygosaccharomyces rouxii]|uniref:ZYRO0G18304p n=1 Tax=Zygosaccharomyces rouxii (strain ATCC 2623 / CBS 732 / NBRC 1130 / NCYC 568 / NRRL Y-229) TaxID=559307 RepID=C5E160_ZYGRC|nr:uncharacterized protein ZYRO0G18304g [Zygosaccharomyces rouxii]KAH9202837.1 hypothetical protein LQ764DRAFT_207793 [Zygosaccharomyces rouxii]CAR29844.1 ZYRO0G18304p [Zygosaccharomyces rouxii]
MQYQKTLASAALASAALSAYVPSEPWSTLTPSKTLPGGVRSYPSTFGISIQTVANGTNSNSEKSSDKKKHGKRAVSQIGDGQIQATTGAESSLAPKATSSAKPSAQAVSQITDGQIQATAGKESAAATGTTTYTPLSTKTSETTATAFETVTTGGTTTVQEKTSAQAVSQITDGQVQATTGKPTNAAAPTTTGGHTMKTTVAPVSQIGDGQIQATHSGEGSEAPKATVPAISQIGDGQVQATTAPQITTVTEGGKKTTSSYYVPEGTQSTSVTVNSKPTVVAVSQIVDGQIQADGMSGRPTVAGSASTTVTVKGKPTVAAVSQVQDGQIQADKPSTSSAAPAATSGVGASPSGVNGTSAATGASNTSSEVSSSDPVRAVSCKNNGTLGVTLNDGVLTDTKGRIGSIVSNHQFQFDGPPPQAGAIYAGGWSISQEGNLAIGDVETFYQCLSGNFYNIYDENIGDQCHPVHLEVIDLTDC